MGGSDSKAMSEYPPRASRQSEINTAGTRNEVRARISDLLFPVAASRAAPLELAVVFLLGAIAAFCRLGDVALRGNVWAEDGAEFLQTALLHNGIAAVFEPFAGYMLLAPRLLAMFVASLPLPSQGIALSLAAAVVQAAVATLAYVGTTGFVRQRVWRALLALAVVAVPVGPEVIDSIANVQWFLLFGGCVCLLWTPRKPVGWGVLFGVMMIATMTSPFAVILLGGALVRLLVQRSRAATVLAGFVATGFAIQTMVMVMAPPRTGATKFGVDLAPARLVAGFVRRVLGDGVLGVGRHPMHQLAPGLQAGVAIAILLVICLTVNDGFLVLARASCFGIMALLTYSLPLVATPKLTTEHPIEAGRYYVAPALLTISAIMCLIGGVSDMRGRRTVRFRVLAVAVCGALVVSLLWGLGSSWTAGNALGRQYGPAWQPSIDQARRTCAASSAKAVVIMPISPPGWVMTMPCAAVRE
jgi:hypothetical protein